jgi:hypothetical protein
MAAGHRLGSIGHKRSSASFRSRREHCELLINFIFTTLQMKKANFDVTHELDEFLMVEKPLTHTKRKANPDLAKMKPEVRQLEEQ